MKLIGRDIRFEIRVPGTSFGVAGAYFNDINYNVDANVIDVSTALSPTGEQRVDDCSAKATITATGFVDAVVAGQTRPSHPLELGGSGSDANFIDLATIGSIVEIRISKLGMSRLTGATMTGYGELHKYAPWQIAKVSLKHGKGAPTEDTMELVGTGGALPANYYPGMTIDE